jgi:hypothetical protein
MLGNGIGIGHSNGIGIGYFHCNFNLQISAMTVMKFLFCCLNANEQITKKLKIFFVSIYFILFLIYLDNIFYISLFKFENYLYFIQNSKLFIFISA